MLGQLILNFCQSRQETAGWVGFVLDSWYRRLVIEMRLVGFGQLLGSQVWHDRSGFGGKIVDGWKARLLNSWGIIWWIRRNAH